jgi:DNA-binding SARP family transcriptional activator
VVLDDHHAADSPAVSAAIEAMADCLPPRGQLLVTSRTPPPATLARLEAYGLLGRLGWESLRLTDAEFDTLHARQGEPGRETADRNRQRVGGWMAGVTLCGPAGDAGTGGRPLLGFFHEHVLDGLDGPALDWLATLSVAPHVDTGLALALTGQDRIQEVLLPLADRQWFIHRTQAGPDRFELHPLLREALGARLETIRGPEERMALVRAAAARLETDGEPEAALPLYRDLAAWPELLRALVHAAPALAATDRLEELDAWISCLPGGAGADPWLLYWQGLHRNRTEPTGAGPILQAAFQIFDARGDATGRALTCAAVVENLAAAGADAATLTRGVDRLLGLPLPDGAEAATDLEARVIAQGTEALRCRFGHPTVADWADRAVALRRHIRDPDRTLQLTAFAAAFQFWRGNVATAAAIVDADARAMPTGARRVLSSLLRGLAPAADARAHTGTPAGADPPIRLPARSRRWLELFVDGAGLDAALRRVGALLPPGQSAAREFVTDAFVTPRIADLAAGGAFADAARIHDLALARDRGPGPSLTLGRGLLRAGQLRALAGQPDTAIAHLDEGLAVARQIGSPLLERRVQLWRAHCHLERGQAPDGDAALRDAVGDGADLTCVASSPWPDDALLARLAARALELELARPEIGNWIRARGLEAPAPHSDAWPWPVRVYTLGRFSLAVDGGAVTFRGKGQKRPLDLLKCLVALGGRGIAVGAIVERLWPESEGDASRKAFDVALLRLRRVLGREDAVLVAEGKVTLNTRVCWVDLLSFERWAGLAEAARDASGRLAATRSALDRYRGSFLELEEPHAWMLPARVRAASRLRRMLLGAGRSLEEAGRLPEAIDLFERVVENPTAPVELWRHLADLHNRAGNPDQAQAIRDRHRALIDPRALPAPVRGPGRRRPRSGD